MRSFTTAGQIMLGAGVLCILAGLALLARNGNASAYVAIAVGAVFLCAAVASGRPGGGASRPATLRLGRWTETISNSAPST